MFILAPGREHDLINAHAIAVLAKVIQVMVSEDLWQVEVLWSHLAVVLLVGFYTVEWVVNAID